MAYDLPRRAALNGSLSYLVAGPQDAQPVVLIHGLGWDAARLWQFQVDALVAAGWRVVAPDMRGVGGSAPLTGPVSIPDYADDVEALIAETGLDAPALVGFSMGCMIAADLALRSPARALVLACGGLRSTPEAAAATDAMLARADRLGPVVFAAEQAEAIFGPAFVSARPEAVEDFAGWRAQMDQPGAFNAALLDILATVTA